MRKPEPIVWDEEAAKLARSCGAGREPRSRKTAPGLTAH